MSETIAAGNAGKNDWKREYETLVKRLGFDIGGDDSNRKHPRFSFAPPEKTLMVHIGAITGVLRDISAGGASFLSRASMTADRQMKISFDQQFAGRVRVVNSSLEGTNFSSKSGMFRTGTRFLDAEDGYRCFVRTMRHFSRDLQV